MWLISLKNFDQKSAKGYSVQCMSSVHFHLVFADMRYMHRFSIFGERFNSHLISVQCYLSDMLERLRKAASPPTISMYQVH